MGSKTFFGRMAELLMEPVEYLANKRILVKHIQEFNMEDGSVFRVTISKLKRRRK